MKEITYKVAINTIRASLKDFNIKGETTDKNLKVSAYAMQDIQLRDYLIGVTAENYSNEVILNYVSSMLFVARGAELAPVHSIRAIHLYSLGKVKEANKSLDEALSLENGYSLALLLRRVFSAGWPAESFFAMSREIHPKVTTEIESGILEGKKITSKSRELV